MSKRRGDEVGDDIEVVPEHLDLQWHAQPRLMRQACRKAAEGKAAARAAKDNAKLVLARVKLGVRQAPERYGWTASRAPSNDVVEEIALTDQSYQLALKAANQAEYEADILEADVQALRDRKAALENSVILWCRDYGSECKLPTKSLDGAARAKLEDRRGGDRWRGATRDVDE